MNRHALLAAAAAVLLLTACGGGSGDDGGGGGGGGTANLIAVQGKLETRDGDTDTLAGVTVTCVETGATDVTDHLGAFQMHVPQQEPFHLDFDDPDWRHNGHPHDGVGEHHDPLPDGTEVDGGGVTLRPDGPQDWCDIEVHLGGGEILECHVRWGRGTDEVRDGERHMDRDPLSDEVGASGEIEISYEEGCLAVEVEVEGFSRAASLEIHLADSSGTEEFIDTLVIDGDGVGHLEAIWCEGDSLPLDASSPEDLAGYAVIVYDETGEVVFRGHLPHHHADGMGHHHHGWEDDDVEHHHGGGPHE